MDLAWVGALGPRLAVDGSIPRLAPGLPCGSVPRRKAPSRPPQVDRPFASMEELLGQGAARGSRGEGGEDQGGQDERPGRAFLSPPDVPAQPRAECRVPSAECYLCVCGRVFLPKPLDSSVRPTQNRTPNRLPGSDVKFIDLFAGLGGFHVALARLGHECVFACELDETLRTVYQKNFGLMPAGDIRTLDEKLVPQHDVLCAGFPCQPFSKAGSQLGFKCPSWGDLFTHVVRILKAKRPRFIILENVPHLAKHDEGRTWAKVKETLEELGYSVRDRRLSPHMFGIPQVRERLIIVGYRGRLPEFEWPTPSTNRPLSIVDLLEKNPADARRLTPQFSECLAVWQDFLEHFPKDEEIPSWPIWSMEFGATYPFEDNTPENMTSRQLSGYKGIHGRPLKDLPPEERLKALPSHARTGWPFPRWKQNFIRSNRQLYSRHSKWLDSWIPKIQAFPSSLQKLEWNCKGEARNIWKYLIQFRASGVRVKRPASAPSLISMTTTQVPIVGWERRYLTARECSRLQSLKELKVLPTAAGPAFAALGNAVNADLVEKVAEQLLGRCPGARAAR